MDEHVVPNVASDPPVPPARAAWARVTSPVGTAGFCCLYGAGLGMLVLGLSGLLFALYVVVTGCVLRCCLDLP